MRPVLNFDHIPHTLEKTAIFKNARSRRKIYEGDFTLKVVEKQVSVKGLIYFSWFPSDIGIKISGSPTEDSDRIILLSHYMENVNTTIYINQTFFGQAIITKMELDGSGFEIKGTGRAIFGTEKRLVDRVLFSVPNLRPIRGTYNVQQTSKSKVNIAGNRFVLENDHFRITLDQRFDGNIVQASLNKIGGFGIMYSGQLEKKGEQIGYAEAIEVINCLSRFLSFINGRKVSPIFLVGKSKRKKVWEDFTFFKNDPYKRVHSILPTQWNPDLNDLWIAFYNLYCKDAYKTILSTTVYWYVEANGNDGVEVKSVLAQAGLELIYDWMVEVNKLSVSKDLDTVGAAGKIRAILHIIGQKTDVPERLKELSQFLIQYRKQVLSTIEDNGKEEIKDACFIIARIRNSLSHSNIPNRKRLKKIPDIVLAESVTLSLWYIELAVLFALGYRGSYKSRCSTALWSGIGQVVPWIEDNK